MLLQFTVGNHGSLRKPQTLSMVASALSDPSAGLLNSPLTPDPTLPSIVIYGANAAGKSNVISAMDFMRDAVLYSHSRGEPGGKIPRKPFALDDTASNVPSHFDIHFVEDGVRYNYGFEVNNDAFTKEWLYSYPKGRRVTLLTREGENITPGPSLRGQNKTIAGLTRSNSLFLSAAAQNDHEQLLGVSSFFKSITIASTISESARLLAYEVTPNIDGRVIDFLSSAGTGVVGYEFDVTDASERAREISKDLSVVIKKYRPDFTADEEFLSKERKFKLKHRTSGGKEIAFDLGWESAGTRRLVILLSKIYAALDAGTLLVIDEFTASLHTQACEALLSLFSNPETNPNGAQLIATTHDTNLLNSQFLRRDQVWFTEKDDEGATHLYPLTSIHTRKSDNIEKGYLQGRFGAVPFSGHLTSWRD